MFYIYQTSLTENQILTINAHGWDNGPDWAKAYANKNFGKFSGSEYITLMNNDIIKHTQTINSNDLDDIFNIGNGYGDQSKRTMHEETYSLSVGDILVSAIDNEAYVVAGFGFTKLSKTFVRILQHKVKTKIGMVA